MRPNATEAAAPSVARRALLGALPAIALAGARTAHAAPPRAAASPDDPSLALLASRRGLRFGSEALDREIAGDADYRALFVRECAALTPGFEAKWDHVEPSPGGFDFAPLDRLVAFGAAHGMAIRMHTLVWGLAMPPWLAAQLRHGTASDAAAALGRHVAAVCGRYRGRVASWDVCNELSDPLWHRGPEGLTLTPWRRALGPDLVPIAFALARAADPHALLMVNEDGLEWRGARFDAKRATYLRLVEGWCRAGVPIGGFGLQTHLNTRDAVDEDAYRQFLATLAGFGLELHLTELDVRDPDGSPDPAIRDRVAADLVRRVLDVALDEPAITTVMTWGLSDRYSYQNDDPAFARLDGLPARPLPFDADLRPTPMRDAIARALAAAPPRRAASLGRASRDLAPA